MSQTQSDSYSVLPTDRDVWDLLDDGTISPELAADLMLNLDWWRMSWQNAGFDRWVGQSDGWWMSFLDGGFRPMKNRTAKTKRDALQIRKATGTRLLEVTAEKAVAALAAKGVPSLLCGGLAVQEYGYPRETNDVDLIVPDVHEAYQILSSADFKPLRDGVIGLMTDRETKVDIDLLPAGKSIGGRLVLPMPHLVSQKPILIDFDDLLSLKLASWENSPMTRSRDHTDVVELIMRRKLPWNLAVEPKVKELWLDIWDKLALERGR